MSDATGAFFVKGNDGITRTLDEHYDCQSDVEQDPYGAWLAIQNLSARLEAVEAERDELRAAKWKWQHTDTMNDIVSMGMARDEAGAKLAQAVEALREISGECGCSTARAVIAALDA
jgi:hypothetical protein